MAQTAGELVEPEETSTVLEEVVQDPRWEDEALVSVESVLLKICTEA